MSSAPAPNEADDGFSEMAFGRLRRGLSTEVIPVDERISQMVSNRTQDVQHHRYQAQTNAVRTRLTPSTSPEPTTPRTKQPTSPSPHSPSQPKTPPNPPCHPHNPHAPHSNNTALAARSPQKSNCTLPCTASDSSTARAPHSHCSSSVRRQSCWCAGWPVGTAGPWCSLLRRRLARGVHRGNSSIPLVG